jgi:hypothetical protein
MQRTVIALRGKSNSGKSSTIRLAYQRLSQEGMRVRPASTRMEIRGAILELNGVKVGFVSLGDLAEILEGYFGFLMSEGCVVIVCATRSYGGTVEFVQGLESDYNIVWVEKERQAVPDQDRDSREKADEIIKAGWSFTG